MNSEHRWATHSLRGVHKATNLARRISVLSAAACLLIACSKPANQNRYDKAIKLAQSYSIQKLPPNLVTLFRSGRAAPEEYFTDVVLHPSFAGKFEAAAQELANQHYFQDDNRYLLNGIVADSNLPCVISAPSPGGNVDCGDDSLQYAAKEIRLLHTDDGDFIFSSANMDRGNGQESNENTSPLVIVVDPTDGGLGLILEDHIAISSGGRRAVLMAVLTLASSIVRLEDPSFGSHKVQLEGIRYDLEAAKSGTLFVKSKWDSADVGAPPSTQNNVAPTDPSAGTQYPDQNKEPTATSYTKEELRNLVVGKTMAEVRAALGEPSNTIDNPDYLIWYYWSDKLQVVDSDAGVTVKSAGVLFDPLAKIAVGVTF